MIKKEFKMLVDTLSQAEKLLGKFDRAGIGASAKITANGKYVVTFTVEVK